MATEVETAPVLNGSLEQPQAPVAVEAHVNGEANGTIESSASSTVDEPSTSSASSSVGAAPAPAPAPLPTYDDIFPALGGPAAVVSQTGPSFGGALSAAASRSVVRPAAGGAPKIRSTNVTKLYRVAPEERRASNRNRFGEQTELSKICSDIMSRTSTDIQLTSSKDGALNFLITGKEEATTTVCFVMF